MASPKRLLDATARELAQYTRPDKLAAIRGNEGRTIASEMIAPAMPLVYDVSNPELAASQGADLLILNVLDVLTPAVQAIEVDSPADVVRHIKRLTGRLVAVNLEPVDPEADLGAAADFAGSATSGRLATPENARRAAELGVDAIVLTGNPGMGVTNAALARATRATREAVGDEIILIVGKMHASGSVGEAGSAIVDDASIEAFVAAGADVVLLPAPGTVPGCHEAQVRGWVETTHRAGALTMTAIGTSQEGADVDTIRRIALMAKMTGTDVHHLGDCGYYGITLPENLVAYSMTIRGRRHTYRRRLDPRHRHHRQHAHCRRSDRPVQHPGHPPLGRHPRPRRHDPLRRPGQRRGRAARPARCRQPPATRRAARRLNPRGTPRTELHSPTHAARRPRA